MIVRFGYVAMSMVLKDCSPSRTVTATNLERIQEPKARISKLLRLARENLHNTQRLLYHNSANDISVYRFTSKLIPLATHPLASDWKWMEDLWDELKSLGSYVKERGMRTSAHPDHFTLLNSPKGEVLEKALKDLEYHHSVFKGMGLDASAKLVIHVGGLYVNKEESVNRFLENYKAVPPYIRERITLENDDKIYTAEDVLGICQKTGAPMVLDVHHDWCNKGIRDAGSLLEDIFETWKGQPLVPKVHISSPKSEKNFRGHSDYIDPDFFLEFLEMAKRVGQDFDVMVEAKYKDRALFRLMEDMKSIKWIKVKNGAAIEC